MPEYLNQLLAEEATALVEESFTGVRAEWWWERRLGGGLAVCQVLDPQAMVHAISTETGHTFEEVERTVEEEFGLEDLEPIVLTFEVPGDTEAREAVQMLSGRSTTHRGLAESLYRRVEEKLAG